MLEISNIAPVTELKKWGTLLQRVTSGKPLVLTKNSKPEYVVMSASDFESYEAYQKEKAIRKIEFLVSETDDDSYRAARDVFEDLEL